MRRHHHTTTVEASPEELYRALTDLRNWPMWDEEIERIDHDGSVPTKGTRFVLKPKGGPKTTLLVEQAVKGSRFADVSLLPLGRMRTVHDLVKVGEERTEIRLTIETSGVLGFLWDRLIAKKQARGAEQQAIALAAFARTNRS